MKFRKLIVLIVVLSMIVFASAKLGSTSDPGYEDDGSSGNGHGHGHGSGKSSQVTVWDERFEIFLEHPFIVANTATEFVTHVTNRKILEPRRKGYVTFVLTDESKRSIKLIENSPARDGIYIPKLTFPHAGTWNLSLVISTEEIDHRVNLPAVTVYGSQTEADHAPAAKEFSGISFLKEQQWKIPFATLALQQREIQGRTVPAVTESAIVDEDGETVAFVQLAGEVFEERELKLGEREHGFAEVLSGISEGEYVVTKGVDAVVEAEHESHDDGSTVSLSQEDVKRFGIEVGTVGPGQFEVNVSIPGEITFNESTLAHIVPGISGIVREVSGDIGDNVTAGEAIAWLESTELGGAKVKYLSRLSEVSCCSIELVRAQEIHDNTLKLLEVLKSSPSLGALRNLDGSGMGMNRSLLVSSYAEFTFARDAYLREKDLYEKKITSKEDFLKADSAFKKADARYVATQDSVRFDITRNLLEAKREQDVRVIELKASERLLYVLGLTTQDINDLNVLSGNPTAQAEQEEECTDPNCTECALERSTGSTNAGMINERLAWYPIRAAFNGTIINRHITLGEFVTNASEIFVVADLSRVWLDLQVHQKDVHLLSKGQEVTVSVRSGVAETKGVIDRVYPLIDGSTRTTVARVVLDNTAGQFRPGMFVTANVLVEKRSAELVVSKSSLQSLDDKTCVFIQDDHGFELRPIEVGLSNDEYVEVVSGLTAGETVVTRNSFRLKAELEKTAGGGHAGHGHAH